MKNKMTFIKPGKLPSISKRLTISLTIAVMIVSAVIISLNYYMNNRKAKAQLDEKADEYVSFLVESLSVPLWDFEVKTIQHIGSVYSRNDLISILEIIGSNDVIYFSTKRYDTEFQVSRKKDIHYKGQFVGTVQLSLSSKTYSMAQKQLLRQSIITILVVLIVITGVTGFLLRAFLRKPLIHLSKSIETYTSGINEIPSHHKNCKEFQPVLTVLREMNEKLIRQMSELQKAEEKYRGIFENAVEGIFQSTPEGRFISTNPTFARIIGYDSPEDLISNIKSIEKQIYVDPKRRKELFHLLEKNKIVKKFESEFYRKDGSIAVISTNARAVRDDENNILFIEGFMEDITDRKLAEKSLRESHETLLTILDGIDATIYAADIETHEILFMNKYMKRIFGYDQEGKSCYQVFRGEPKPCQNCTKSKLVDSKGRPTEVFVWEGQNPVTKRWYINYDRAVKWIDGRIVLLQVATDITDFKIAEEDKRKLESQLLRVEKLEAIGTLAGGIAHDFNNLLMGIQGRASLISVDLKPSHPHSEHIKAIEEYIRNATDLTRQLLGFARGGKYEVKPTDINELVNNSSNMFGRTKKELSIHTKFQNPPPVVAVDRRQIEQVLLNLYVNAWQAMPGGGKLYLETQIATLDDSYSKTYQVKPGRYAKVSVTDTGIGMDETIRQRIFDPFFTTKEKDRGTGLGLASAYGIIKNHDGIITVYSEVGQGTTFNIYLPLSDKEVYQEVPIIGRLIKGSETILLVDDEEMITKVGLAMLKKLGYHVVVADGGKQAVDEVRQKGEKIDLVILDLIMPGMEGGEVFDCIKEIKPQMPVILSSGYAVDGKAGEIMKRGCNGFIQKPFNISELSQKVRKILDETKSSVQG